MTHRTEVAFLDADDMPEKWEREMINTRYSVYPVFRGSSDNVIGSLSIKDYFKFKNRDKEEILKQAPEAQETVASWFMMKPELRKDTDLHLRDEDDYINLVEKEAYDVIYADPCMKRMTPKFDGNFIATIHFAVSGHLAEARGSED